MIRTALTMVNAGAFVVRATVLPALGYLVQPPADVMHTAHRSEVARLTRERDAWRDRFDRMRAMYRDRFTEGLSPVEWHLKYCAAMSGLDEVRLFHAEWGDTDAEDLDPLDLWEQLDRILHPAPVIKGSAR